MGGKKGAKMKRISAPAFLLASCLAILAGCDNDDSSTEVLSVSAEIPTAPNITLVAISRTEQSVYRKGEPISIGFSVSSSGISAENLLASFSLVPVSELELLKSGGSTSAESFGELVIESIAPGYADYQVDLTIPNNLVGGQDFVILAALDPESVISNDSNAADNISRGFTPSFDHPTTKVITVTDTFINDLSIENAAVGEGFILLETPSSVFPNGTTPSNVVLVDDDPRESNVVGHIDVKKLGADSMNAYIRVDVIVNGAETAGYMWKGENDEWTNEAQYTVPSPDEVHFVPWDIRLVAEQRDALFAAYDASATENVAIFRFQIQQTSGAQDENPANNSFELEVPYRFYTPGDESDIDTASLQAIDPSDSRSLKMPSMDFAELGVPIEVQAASSDSCPTPNSSAGKFSFEKSYSQTYGDTGKFAVNLSFVSENNISGLDGSASIHNEAKVNAYALGTEIELARAFGDAGADVLNRTAGYHGYVRVFGKVVLDEEKSVSADYDKEWNLTWSEEKTFARATFFAGPIPITINAGAEGSMGFGASLALAGSELTGEGKVFFAKFEAYATGGIDVGFASGGIRADMLLLDTSLTATGTADLSQILRREVTLSAKVTNALEAIKGKFSLYARYPVWKWWGFRTKEKTFTLYSTGALFDKSWDLLNVSKTVCF